MKMNFKYLTMFAAACAVGFSSCSSEADGIDPLTKGEETKFSLTIGGPVTYVGDDVNATTGEVDFDKVDVFVYKNGTLETCVQRNKAQHFTQVSGTNTWTLKSENKIPTTTGAKTIYVGVNLPTAILNNIKADGTTAAVTIDNLSALKSDGFAMFSTEATSKVLYEDDTQNNVSVSVARLVAKVIFYGGASYTVTSGGTLSGLSFTTGNVNNKFYPMPYSDFSDPNFTSADQTQTFLHPTAFVDPYAAINATGTDVVDARAVYATENSAVKGATQGALTYGIIKGMFTPAEVVELTTPADGDSELKPATVNPDGTFYLVRVSNSGVITNYFFANKAHAETFVVAKGSETKYVLTYTGGTMYYSVFLKDAVKAANVSEFSIFRNTIYQVTVTGVNGIGSYTDVPGAPGDDDPLIPGIIDPKDPPVIEGKDANITVNVEIVKWSEAAKQDEVLQGK